MNTVPTMCNADVRNNEMKGETKTHSKLNMVLAVYCGEVRVYENINMHTFICL